MSFAGAEVALAEALPPAVVDGLRDALRTVAGPETKLRVLERFVAGQIGRAEARERARRSPHQAVCLALERLEGSAGRCTVASLARSAGVSERRLRTLFLEQVGVTPKLLGRILRFREAVSRLHRGDDLAWAELALECGFGPEPLLREFRAFSGVDPTTLLAQPPPVGRAPPSLI